MIRLSQMIRPIALALFLSLAAPAAWAAGVQPAIKNFRQIFQSLVAATGIPGTTGDIASYYADAQTRLPRNGVVGEVSAPMMLSFTALSSLFCRDMIQADRAKAPSSRRAHKKVDFTKGQDAFTPAIRENVIEEYAGLFWGRSPSAIETLLVLELIDEVGAGELPAAAVLDQMLLLACTSVASSVDGLTF
jgi:hypothetical protein